MEKVFTSAHSNIYHGDSVNCAKYMNGVRSTFGVSPEPFKEQPKKENLVKATEPQLRELFANGWTIQLPKPYPYSDEVYGLVKQLENYFDQVVSANIYATPPGTQGFAPHHDATEIFIMQIEGTKRWQVWAPHTLDDQLTPQPRTKFHPQEMQPPVLNVTLYPGKCPW